MTRLIFTFETVFQVLSADKVLRDKINCRTVPTPSGLSSSICGISIELLDHSQETQALSQLEANELNPKGVFRI